MKTASGFVLLTLLSVSPLLAQTTFTSTTSVDSQITKSIPGAESQQDRARAAEGRLQPRPTGIIYSISKDGLVVISPVAGKQYGYGERFLTTNPNTAGSTVNAGNHGENRDFGGLKLFGWEF